MTSDLVRVALNVEMLAFGRPDVRAGDEGRVAAVTCRINEHELTNISPEATSTLMRGCHSWILSIGNSFLRPEVFFVVPESSPHQGVQVPGVVVSLASLSGSQGSLGPG